VQGEPVRHGAAQEDDRRVRYWRAEGLALAVVHGVRVHFSFL
jgi:hypothetical protein